MCKLQLRDEKKPAIVKVQKKRVPGTRNGKGGPQQRNSEVCSGVGTGGNVACDKAGERNGVTPCPISKARESKHGFCSKCNVKTDKGLLSGQLHDSICNFKISSWFRARIALSRVLQRDRRGVNEFAPDMKVELT